MKLSDINTTELSGLYFEGSFCDYWNDLEINKFKIVTTEKEYNWDRSNYLAAQTLKYLQKLHKKMDNIYYLDVDKGVDIVYENEVHVGSNEKGDVIVTLSPWFERQYENKTGVVNMWKYMWFEMMRETYLYVSIPNQNTNRNIDIYINEEGELIIDNTEK